MRSGNFFAAAFLSLGLLVLTGCFKALPPPNHTRSTADTKFIKICTEEFKLPVVIQPLKTTVWVYLPLTERLFDYQASPKKKSPALEQPVQEKRAINLLEAEFKDPIFSISYDISKTKKYSKDLGYGSAYSDKYQKTQRDILTAAYRAYADIETVPGDIEFPNDYERDLRHRDLVRAYVKTDKPPDFLVLVIADITRGIETKMIINFGDLLRGTTDGSFYEEYSRRIVNVEPLGDTAIIDDRAGTHLNLTDVDWPEFLAKQMMGRIRFKYEQSDFPPQDVDANEILKLIHATVSAYSFDKFTGVELHDLGQKKDMSLRKEQLATFGE